MKLPVSITMKGININREVTPNLKGTQSYYAQLWTLLQLSNNLKIRSYWVSNLLVGGFVSQISSDTGQDTRLESHIYHLHLDYELR